MLAFNIRFFLGINCIDAITLYIYITHTATRYVVIFKSVYLCTIYRHTAGIIPEEVDRSF